MVEYLGRDSDRDVSDANESYSEFVQAIKQNMDPASNSVLIVDDEKGIRRKVARDVTTFDDSIVIAEAANGKEALEKLTELRRRFSRDPLFIVLDLNMPVMDGWALIKELRRDYESRGRHAGIPIVVLSSTSGEKGALFARKSVHDGKSRYTPLVTVAKETCIDKVPYDAAGDAGLMAWLEYFVKRR